MVISSQIHFFKSKKYSNNFLLTLGAVNINSQGGAQYFCSLEYKIN